MLIIGHRGNGTNFYNSLLRENSLASMKTAMESKIDMIELDIQVTKDNIVIVFHDF